MQSSHRDYDVELCASFSFQCLIKSWEPCLYTEGAKDSRWQLQKYLNKINQNWELMSEQFSTEWEFIVWADTYLKKQLWVTDKSRRNSIIMSEWSTTTIWRCWRRIYSLMKTLMSEISSSLMWLNLTAMISLSSDMTDCQSFTAFFQSHIKRLMKHSFKTADEQGSHIMSWWNYNVET